MCAVTRAVLPETELIRFVAAPDGSVVADLKAKLPGRGVWVGAERRLVAEAVKRNVFQRGLKQPLMPPADLPDQVGGRLKEAALGRLGLARKAGAVVAGFAKVEAAIASERLAGVILAADAAEDGGPPRSRRRFTARFGDEVPRAGPAALRVGGIEFGIGAAKCDTCCRAPGPGWQEFHGSGYPSPALRGRGRWPGGNRARRARRI